ncbi:MAG TPA: prepilin-type N-terminal cleavage/methylation domain-containing protein [Syntrophobacteria bacterium]|nr:prepilin-type N-terminal cleavage/methylation domain-containing protein [Syntrophobacteria bacterium]
MRRKGYRGQIPSPQGGFSLVEVLVAVILLAVAFLALARMQTHAAHSNVFGNQLTEATILAQDRIEALRSLNDQHLAVLGKPQATWTTDDQNIVTAYENQLTDSEDNWDAAAKAFNWLAPLDHVDPNNPIDVKGATATTGGYTRVWNVVDNVPVAKAKTIHVRVTWASGRQVTLTSVISQ